MATELIKIIAPEALEKRIAHLNARVVALEDEEKEKQNLLTDIALDIVNKKAEQERLAAALSESQDVLAAKQQADNERLSGENARLTAENAVLRQTTAQEKEQIVALASQKSSFAQDAQSLNDQTLQKQNELKSISGAVEEKNSELATLSKNVTFQKNVFATLTKDNADLTAKKEEMRCLIADIKQQQVKLDEVVNALAVVQAANVAKRTEAVGLEGEIADLKKTKAKLEADNVEYAAQLTQREGESSIKESWLKEKEEMLRNTRTELEKFYNRRINVNF